MKNDKRKINVGFFLIILFVIACNNDKVSKNEKLRDDLIEKKLNKREKSNEKLIGYKSVEVGEANYKIGYGKFNFDLNKIKVDYVDDLIIVKTNNEVNACGKYKMNIDYQSDTIILKYELIDNNLCKSLRIDELTYIIDNSEQKKWKMIKEKISK